MDSLPTEPPGIPKDYRFRKLYLEEIIVQNILQERKMCAYWENDLKFNQIETIETDSFISILICIQHHYVDIGA